MLGNYAMLPTRPLEEREAESSFGEPEDDKAATADKHLQASLLLVDSPEAAHI